MNIQKVMNPQKVAYDFTYAWEAGYGNTQGDPGGETLDGISRKYHPNELVWKLVDELKRNIVSPYDLKKAVQTSEIKTLVNEFYEDWWFRHQCDKMPLHVSIAYFDSTFMTGESTWLLQRAINFLYMTTSKKLLKDDNILGEKTIGALNREMTRTHEQGLTQILLSKRGKYQMHLRKKMNPFKAGWADRTFHLQLYLMTDFDKSQIKGVSRI